MKIRRGKKGDFKELFKIMNSAPELRHVKQGNNYNKEWVRDMIKDKRRYACLIAEENGRIEGFVTAELWRDEEYSFMLDLYVSPEYRKKGVATALMNEHEKICKKAKCKILLTSVLVHNKKMQGLLRKRKYEKGTEVYYFEKRLR